MLVTHDWMVANYNKYNNLYWNGRLPIIELKINRTKQRWGYAEYRWWSSGIVKPLSITLSNYYDSPEDVKLTTLLHEMIHIYDYAFHPEHFVVNGHHNRRYDAHGSFFKAEAARLSKYGWDIEKYVTAEEKSVSTLSKKSEMLKTNKINSALLCVLVGTNGYNWVMKTSKWQVGTLLKTIKTSTWRNTLGEIHDINFYTFDNERIATMRSNATTLRGWKYTNRGLLKKLEEYKATEVHNVA